MIQLQLVNEAFQLSIKNQLILTHSPHQPCLFIGKGKGRYNMVCGNFEIGDQLHEKVALGQFTIAEESGQRVVVDFSNKTSQDSENPWQLTMICEEQDGRLEIQFKASGFGVNRFWIRLCASATEHIYGCGEQFSVLDLKGKIMPLWVSEGGVGRSKDAEPILAMSDIRLEDRGDWYTTYYPQPTFISSANYFYHLESSAYAEFDFSDPESHQLHIWEVPQKIIFDTQDSAPAILKSLTDSLGRQQALPDWVHDGVWLGAQGGTKSVGQKLQLALNADVKVAAIWAQDWEGKRITAFGKQLFWDWKYDRNLYPDLPQYIQQLNEQGIKFLGYINPFLALKGELYQEASQKDYLVKKENGEEYHVMVTTFPAALLDLTNPEAVAWIKDVIKASMIGIGLSGWMADYGEYLPTDAALASGEPAETFHNRYPAEWARVNLEAVTEAGKNGKIVFFTRAGYTGTSEYSTLMWAGDQLVSWSLHDGLASTISASVSSGFCGIGFTHSDIGGFTTLGPYKRSKELFMRWAEMAVFSAVMKTHEGNRPDDNWQFDTDEETLEHFAAMSRLHAQLKPYITHAIKEYRKTGLPLMRHPYIHYEDDEQLHTLQYQYLFGRDLMAAPVYLPGVTAWKIYLPDDRWGFLWDNNEYGQGWHTIEAPLGQPPVFYRLRTAFIDLFESLESEYTFSQ